MSPDIVERIGELRAALTELQDHVESAIGAAGASRRYEDFVRAVTDWVWETDANLNYVSDGIAAVFGVPAAVMEGRYLFALSHFRQIDEPVQPRLQRGRGHRSDPAVEDAEVAHGGLGARSVEAQAAADDGVVAHSTHLLIQEGS